MRACHDPLQRRRARDRGGVTLLLGPDPGELRLDLAQFDTGERIALIGSMFYGTLDDRVDATELRLEYGAAPDKASIRATLGDGIGATLEQNRSGPAKLQVRVADGGKADAEGQVAISGQTLEWARDFRQEAKDAKLEATDEELEAYLATGEALHVAGSFTLDGRSAPFLSGIVGDHGNVIGLSLPLFRRLLGELDLTVMDLWVP